MTFQAINKMDLIFWGSNLLAVEEFDGPQSGNIVFAGKFPEYAPALSFLIGIA